MDRETYERLVKNSTTGKREEAKPSKYLKIRKDRFKKAVVTMCLACVTFGAVAFQGAKALANQIGDAIEIQSAVMDFKKEAIYENTHRTNNGEHYWYDYSGIAEHVKTDEDVFLLYQNIGEKQTDYVLQYVDQYDSVHNFLEKHNYKDKEDWVKTANKQILLKNEIEEKQNQLNDMQSEYEANTVKVAEVASEQELGGK